MDVNCFEKKYEEYKQMLFKICMIHLKNNNDVQDVLQNTFIKLIYEAPDFQDKEYEKCWLIRVAINGCKNYQKSFWHRSVDLTDNMIVTANESDKNLMYTIHSLPFHYRNVLHLYYYEKYSIKEISEILKVSESAVKMRLLRARETLKWELEERK